MNILQKIFKIPDTVSGRLFVDPERNGEYRFARSYVRDRMVVLDVGANIGDYSRYLLRVANTVNIHCFEPISSTYLTLQDNLRRFADAGQVVLNNIALSDNSGSAEMFVCLDNAGSNSLY